MINAKGRERWHNHLKWLVNVRKKDNDEDSEDSSSDSSEKSDQNQDKEYDDEGSDEELETLYDTDGEDCNRTHSYNVSEMLEEKPQGEGWKN